VRKRWIVVACALAAVVALPVGVVVRRSLDESHMRTVQATFVGMDRADAVSRLRGMGLTPTSIRPAGDLEITFANVPRPMPSAWRGACGAYPSLVLHVRGSRVVRVGEHLDGLACL
jgi:hypothetical protein